MRGIERENEEKLCFKEKRASFSLLRTSMGVWIGMFLCCSFFNSSAFICLPLFLFSLASILVFF